MKNTNNRRSFIRKIAVSGIGVAVLPSGFLSEQKPDDSKNKVTDQPVNNIPSNSRKYNKQYTSEYLDHIAFPVGGTGAGMFCIEGNGAISHFSVRHNPQIYNEPLMFGAIHIKGVANGTRILEGPIHKWKRFEPRGSAMGSGGHTWGLPRFSESSFLARFPFGEVQLQDEKLPLKVELTAWNPFIPTDEDNSGLPVAGLEYNIHNTSSQTTEYVFSYNSSNIMSQSGGGKRAITPVKNGFVLSQEGTTAEPEKKGDFIISTDDPAVTVDCAWFRGGGFDTMAMQWDTIKKGEIPNRPPLSDSTWGGSIYVPFSLKPGEKKTIKIRMAWYVPDSNLRIVAILKTDDIGLNHDLKGIPKFYKPWYSTRFKSITDVSDYWQSNYDDLREKSLLFTNAFYKSTLPDEVIEAVAANLTTLKSPTVMRQHDGRIWSWEGCGDDEGSCHGNCTHVWNYAQAIPHLFPSLERTMRRSEFFDSQDASGHQSFRTAIPIQPSVHNFHAASDGQLGGVMKVYREWRISGDSEWLKNIYPKVKISLDYCIKSWDPHHRGVIEEPHHNTYDIEFWGADPMITGFYLGALQAMIKMGKFLKKDVKLYEQLYSVGKIQMEGKLYNGEHFVQHVSLEGLNNQNPVEMAKHQMFTVPYSEEGLQLLKKEGPRYQYGTGVLSDGAVGTWIARVCGLEEPVDTQKIKNHLVAVHKYNLKKDLRGHENVQRPGFAMGDEGGLLLCSWPKGDRPSLPFVYSDEVWTGIEYQVASHLIFHGKVDEGLEIVRTARNRYNGLYRNPFDEYEAGHWYARALSSYGLLEALTGVRYDAIDKILYIDSKVGDFTSFFSAATGFGTVSLKNGQPSVAIKYGRLDIKKVLVSGKEVKLT